MKGKNVKKAVVAVFASLIMSLSACGNEQASFDVDYEGGDTTESVFNDMSSDIEEQYGVDVEVMPKYKIKMIDEKNIDEIKIAKNFFGDSAKPLRDGDMITFTEADEGNPIYERIFNINTKYATGSEISEAGKYDSWIDAEFFYTHVYEGTYRKTDYLLLIAYGKTEHVMYTSLYPKCPGAIVGDESLDQLSYSYNNGMVSVGKEDHAKFFSLDDLTNDNISTLSEDEFARIIKDTLNEKLEVGIINDEILFNSNSYVFNEMPDEKSADDIRNCEVVFYNNDILDDVQHTGMIRNGYAASLGGYTYQMSIMADIDFGGYAEQFGGYNIYYGALDIGIEDMVILVDDDGVFGFNLSFRYSILETTYDAPTEFDDSYIIESLGGDPSKGIDDETEKKLENVMMRIVYFYQASDNNPDEGMLVPAFVYTNNAECIILDANSGELIEKHYFAD